MIRDKKIYVAGHGGMLGSAIRRRLEADKYPDVVVRTRSELDLTNQLAVNEFFEAEKPAIVFLAAAKVGGILANFNHPAQFIRDNLLIQTNVVEAAYKWGTDRLIFMGSSCIYPKLAPQPIKEEHLLTGTLEPTNEPYAVAKIAGIKMCQAYQKEFGFDCVNVMATNLFGPNDNFDPESSHVLAALLRKFHEAKVNGDSAVNIWGTGRVKREFLYVEDLADACIFLAEQSSEALDRVAPDRMFNVGWGMDLEIRELAELIQKVVGIECELVFDTSKPDGTPRKLLDVSRMKELGWTAPTPLEQGIRQMYDWYVEHHQHYRAGA